MDEARCAARMSVVVGLGLERTPTWSSCGRGGAYFVSPGLSYNAEITLNAAHHTATKRQTADERGATTRSVRYAAPPGPRRVVDSCGLSSGMAVIMYAVRNRIPQIQYINVNISQVLMYITHVNISQES